jgi:hypothetical protein
LAVSFSFGRYRQQKPVIAASYSRRRPGILAADGALFMVRQ